MPASCEPGMHICLSVLFPIDPKLCCIQSVNVPLFDHHASASSVDNIQFTAASCLKPKSTLDPLELCFVAKLSNEIVRSKSFGFLPNMENLLDVSAML